LRKGKARLPTATEKDIYDALGLPFIPPELREGRGEVEKAGKSRLPVLVERRDVKGVLHAHTDQSDGVATLAQMAAACRDSGYGYLGITDHSQSAHYAGGLSEKEVARQQREIDRLNKRNAPFRIFKGIESDILPDGALDYPDEVLKTFDFVIASVHGQFRKDKSVQTRRIIKAVSNPYTTVLGHITGRQLLRRHGYDVDIEAILKACAAHGVAIEVNGHPWRLDLDWRWLDRALELGCLISLDPDAHSVAEIDNVRWAVAMARKGGVPKEKIINCMSADQFAQFLRRKSLH
jgi:DNA polymerase (family 10)